MQFSSRMPIARIPHFLDVIPVPVFGIPAGFTALSQRLVQISRLRINGHGIGKLIQHLQRFGEIAGLENG